MSNHCGGCAYHPFEPREYPCNICSPKADYYTEISEVQDLLEELKIKKYTLNKEIEAVKNILWRNGINE